MQGAAGRVFRKAQGAEEEVTIQIKPYITYCEQEILSIYASVGWTAYTHSPDELRAGFENSLLTLGAYEEEKLIGLIRVVGDGHTVILIQDVLLYPDYQRKGIGTMLFRAILERFSSVRQIQLATDDTEKTKAFYSSLGFREMSELGCCAFMKG